MDFSQVNFLAVFVSAMTSFLIGGLWYSPIMFGQIWMKENNFTDESLKKRNMGKIFSLSFILALVVAIFLGAILDPASGLAEGMLTGVLAAAGWVATSFGIIYLFEGKSIKLFAVNAGYFFVSFAVMGGILGLWK